MMPVEQCQHSQLRERYTNLIGPEDTSANYGDRCPDCGWLVSARYVPGQGVQLNPEAYVGPEDPEPIVVDAADAKRLVYSGPHEWVIETVPPTLDGDFIAICSRCDAEVALRVMEETGKPKTNRPEDYMFGATIRNQGEGITNEDNIRLYFGIYEEYLGPAGRGLRGS